MKKSRMSKVARQAAADRMRKMRSDPAFEEKRLKRASETMKAQYKDPEFVAKRAASLALPSTRLKRTLSRFPVLANLTPQQLDQYRIFMKHSFTSAEALAIVSGINSKRGAGANI